MEVIRRERIEPIRVYFVNSARFPADAGKSATSKEVNSQYMFLRDQKQLRHLKFAKRTWPNIQLALNICENKKE